MGIGWTILQSIRTVTFGIALIAKIKKSINQTEEAKTTIKIGGGLTMFFLIIFASIQIYNWIHKEDVVLIYQINFIISYIIFGIIIPSIIIKRSENMTLYLKRNFKKCLPSPTDMDLQPDKVDIVVIPNTETPNDSIAHSEKPDDLVSQQVTTSEAFSSSINGKSTTSYTSTSTIQVKPLSTIDS